MQRFTRPGDEVSVPPGFPRSPAPAFVAGMGRRMALAGLRSRPATSGRAAAAAVRPAVEAAPPAHAPRVPRSSAAVVERGAATGVLRAAALCLLAATGASLLYWQKSRAALQDRAIGRAMQATQEAHARTAVLRTEWAALNEPGRLQDMADRLLALRLVAPAQFVEPAALQAWLEAPASAAPPPAADPEVATAPEAAPPPVPERPASRTRLAAAAPAPFVPSPPLTSPPLPLPPAPPRPFPPRPAQRAVLAAALAVEPRPHPAREAAAPRFELPRWLTQGRSPRPTVLALSGPPRALVLPPVLRPAAVPDAPPRLAPAPPPRSFAVVAATSGDAAYDDRPAGWYPRPAPGWPYGASVRPPYGWSPPYGQPFVPY